MAGGVLVLNADLGVLHTVSLRHAIRMLIREVAEVHEAADELFGDFIKPVSIRLVRYVNTVWRYNKSPKWSKNGVLLRDKHSCAFCAGKADTIDHVKPRAQGGTNRWDNTVAACSPCNNRKGNRTPEEAGMKLLITPKVPRWSDLYRSRS